jgi:predicted DNA-binding protein with PD1-like motif
MSENITVQLEDNEEIFENLEKVVRENNITYGFIVGAKGSIKDFEMIAHGQRGAVEKHLSKRFYEVNALSGKVQMKNGGEIFFKVNALISSSGFTPITGELVRGKAAGALEIIIKKVDMGKMIEA